MSVYDTVSYRTAGTVVLIGGETMQGVTGLSGLGGGTSTEVDVTRLDSRAVETQQGLQDGGTITVSGVAAFQTTLFETLRSANADGTALAVVVGIGKPVANTGATAGDAIDVATNRGLTASVNSGFVDFVDADNNGLPGIVAGDYIQYYTGTSPSHVAATPVRITNVAVSGNNATFTTTLTTNPATLTTGNVHSFVRPGIKYSMTARVPTIDISTDTNEVARYSISLRVTGAVSLEVGTPNVTL